MNRLFHFFLTLLVLAFSCQNKVDPQDETKPVPPPPTASTPEDIIVKAFEEAAALAEADQASFWGTSLSGPILVVDPQTRKVWANQPDPEKSLQMDDQGIYTGTLPSEINVANTAFDWQGERWTMVMAPLPTLPVARKTLLMHELFHRIQPSIGFDQLNDGDNSHLDEEQARIYLKLELEALKTALNNSFNGLVHIQNALLFREKRHNLYPKAKRNENALEINEGLAQYTGVMMSGAPAAQIRSNFFSSINRFFETPSFVRAFAYETIPVYGFFMRQKDPQWHRKINQKTNLTDWMHAFFEYTSKSATDDEVVALGKEYNYEKITDTERVRAFQKKQQLRYYTRLLVDGPTLELPLINANFSFDYNLIVPLKRQGTVYPKIEVTADWGTLKVEKAALMSPNWDKITVPAANSVEVSAVSGEGWTMTLHEGWKIERGKLVKQQQ